VVIETSGLTEDEVFQQALNAVKNLDQPNKE